jgi:hypothetical protein
MLGLPTVPEARVDNFVMLVVHDEGYAESAQIMFDSLWQQATPVESI